MTLRKRLLGFVTVSIIICLPAFGAITFTDQDVDQGNLNPTDSVVVQRIAIANGSNSTMVITAVTVENSGTAPRTSVAKLEILNEAFIVYGSTANLAGFSSGGVTIGMTDSFMVPSGGNESLQIRLSLPGKEDVADKHTLRTRVRVHYLLDGDSASTDWITDGAQEVVRKAGLETVEDQAANAGILTAGDTKTVQQILLEDRDANAQDVTITKLKVKNLGNAVYESLAKLEFNLSTNPAIWHSFTTITEDIEGENGQEFVLPTAFVIPDTGNDGGSAVLSIRVTLSDPANITDGSELRLITTLCHWEKDPVDDSYEMGATDGAPEILLKGGFEHSSDVSTVPVSGVVNAGEHLTQKIHLADDDSNTHGVTITRLHVKNLGTSQDSDFAKIRVRTGTYTIVDNVSPSGLSEDGLWIDIGLLVGDDGSTDLYIDYYISSLVHDGDTFKPSATVEVTEPPSQTFASADINYPSEVTLYSGGLEIVEDRNINAGDLPRGGTTVVQVIRLVDIDENNYDVFIHPVVIKNKGSATAEDITEIIVMLGTSELGSTTELSGFNSGGVAISATGSNQISDLEGGHEVLLTIKIKVSSTASAGKTVRPETTIFNRENNVTYEKSVTDGTAEEISSNIAPTISLPVATTEVHVGQEVTFTAQGSDADGTVESYDWDFGDGNTEEGGESTAVHTYDNPGTYIVLVTVIDNEGASSVSNPVEITVSEYLGPVAEFRWAPEAPAVGGEVTFTDESATPTGTTITKWSWDFDDDGTEDSSEQNPKHTYNAAGTYTVSLTVTNSNAQTDTVPHDVEVSAAKPTADFDYSPATPDIGDTVTFTDKSTAAGEATIESWSWNFGDGQTTTVKNPTHTFDTMGTYTVSLTVTASNDQTSNVYTEQIVVGPPVMVYSYPNPASDAATFVYRVPDGATDLKLRIFDITGALVYEADLTAGVAEHAWGLVSTAGDPLPNGLYLCVVTAKNATGGALPPAATFKLLIQR